MKKTSPSEDLASSPPAEPLIPGTEEPRSLGDILRDAEKTRAEQQDQIGSQAQTAQPAPTTEVAISDQQEGRSVGAATKQPRRQKKVSRAQLRRYARERALQALYQWDVSLSQSSDVLKQFMDEQDMSRVDVDYFVRLFTGVSHNPQKYDDLLLEGLDRPINELDPIERGVLRIATYELSECLDTPARVIINESIEITKRFGADKGHRYVNGVLDKLASTIRPLEMKRR